MKLTAAEAARLDALRVEMGEFNYRRARRGDYRGLLTEEREALDGYASRWNAVLDAAAARARKAANEARVAREAAALKASVCPSCFTVHAGECL
jgi:predicted aminopeptidase